MQFSPEKKTIKITETFSNRNGLIKLRTENHRNNDNNNSEKKETKDDKHEKRLKQIALKITKKKLHHNNIRSLKQTTCKLNFIKLSNY